MGCALSCKVFEEFASFLNWLTIKQSGFDSVDHYLDDFIFIAQDYQSCNHIVSTFKNLCAEIGVPLAEDKTVGPTTCLTFLGLEIDTVQMLVKIQASKSLELQVLIQEFLSKNKTTLKHMQSLFGKLIYFTRAILPGRAFVRRLYDATIWVTKPHHHIFRTCTSCAGLLSLVKGACQQNDHPSHR